MGLVERGGPFILRSNPNKDIGSENMLRPVAGLTTPHCSVNRLLMKRIGGERHIDEMPAYKFVNLGICPNSVENKTIHELFYNLCAVKYSSTVVPWLTKIASQVSTVVQVKTKK